MIIYPCNYKKARVKLKNEKLNKLKPAAKKKTEATLKITKKKSEDEELHHELFLTKRKRPKIRNDFSNNILTDIKLCKVHLSKIVQSGGFLGNMINYQGKEALMNLGVPLAKDV